MASIIKVEHLSYVYNPGMPNAVTALDDVSFEVEEGDTEGNPTGTVKRFTEAYPNGTYTFDWYLGGLGSMSKNFLPNKKTFRSC